MVGQRVVEILRSYLFGLCLKYKTIGPSEAPPRGGEGPAVGGFPGSAAGMRSIGPCSAAWSEVSLHQMSSSSSVSQTGMSTPSVAGAVCAGASPLAAGGAVRGAGKCPAAACRGVSTACVAQLLHSVGRRLPSSGSSSLEPVRCCSAQTATGSAPYPSAIVTRNSALVFTFFILLLSSSIASTTFMSDKTFRRR